MVTLLVELMVRLLVIMIRVFIGFLDDCASQWLDY